MRAQKTCPTNLGHVLKKKLISLKKLIMGVFCSASYQTHVRSAALRAVHGSIKRKMIYKNHFIEPFY
jgi:hypothetical protein